MSEIVAFLHARLDEDRIAAENTLRDVSQHGTVNVWMANAARQALREVDSKREILRLHEDWPVLVQKQPTYETERIDLNGMVLQMSQQIAWMTEREYVKKFGEDPPTSPIVRAMAGVYCEHPDYDPRWSDGHE